MSNYWKSWTPEKVKAAAMDQLVANGEIVGKFVETEAKRRLVAINDPAWGAKYRRQVVARRLTYVVKREPNAVVTTIGVMRGAKGDEQGLWIELGTRSRTVVTKAGKKRRIPGYPAHPYLRPAVFDNGREIVNLLAGR